MAEPELELRVRAAFARAREKLAAARALLGAGLWSEVVGPAYYAVFHAAEAALFVEGDEPRSHEGVKSLFGLRLVRTGRLPVELASILRELKDEREDGDYALFPAITRDDAERAVSDADRFVREVEAFVSGQGFATSDGCATP